MNPKAIQRPSAGYSKAGSRQSVGNPKAIEDNPKAVQRQGNSELILRGPKGNSLQRPMGTQRGSHGSSKAIRRQPTENS